MGAVYLARDPQLQREVAIKLLSTTKPPTQLSPGDTVDLRSDVPTSPDDPLREARMMARLSHQNVLPVYEVGVTDSGVFVVMEYVDGTDLASWLVERRSTAEILEVFGQAARGLLAAHQRGVVHRDVKPANILIGADGRVRVADFGLSRLLGRPTSAMVRPDLGFGTPHYMAPELWRGEAATPSSDVFALCIALLDALGAAELDTRERALREHGVKPRLRDALMRGLAEDPIARPRLDELLYAIDGRRERRWRIWALAGGGAAAAVAAAVIVVWPAGASPPSCTADPQLLAGWNPARQQELRTQLAGKNGFARQAADRVIADLEEWHRAIEKMQVGTCKAARAAEITEAQRLVRESCADRRRFDLAASIDFMFAQKSTASEASDRVAALSPVAECAEIASPPIGDRAAAEKLWRRFVNSAVDAVPDRVEKHIAELTAIEKLAGGTGEIDLAARAALWLGIEHRFVDRLEEADKAFQRAYRRAVELRLTELSARILVERSSVANRRGDGASAKSYGELAMDIAGRPTTSPDTRAGIYDALGRAASTRGDYKVAVEHLRRSIELRKDPKARSAVHELGSRFALIDALASMPQLDPGLVDLARETLEFARKEVGEQDDHYATALNYVGQALHRTRDMEGALKYYREALELSSKILPPDSSSLVVARSAYAGVLYFDGQAEAARVQLEQVMEQAQKNEGLRRHWAQISGLHANATFDVGRTDEGIALATRALEEGIALHGKDHPTTMAIRWYLISMELETRRTESAARNLAALLTSMRAAGEERRVDVLRVEATHGAEVALQQGKPRAAEAAVRAALAEKKFSEEERAPFYRMLGKSLIRQRRHAAARRQLLRTLKIGRKVDWRPEFIAAVEAQLAVAEAGMGKRGARARRVTWRPSRNDGRC